MKPLNEMQLNALASGIAARLVDADGKSLTGMARFQALEQVMPVALMTLDVAEPLMRARIVGELRAKLPDDLDVQAALLTIELEETS